MSMENFEYGGESVSLGDLGFAEISEYFDNRSRLARSFSKLYLFLFSAPAVT